MRSAMWGVGQRKGELRSMPQGRLPVVLGAARGAATDKTQRPGVGAEFLGKGEPSQGMGGAVAPGVGEALGVGRLGGVKQARHTG